MNQNREIQKLNFQANLNTKEQNYWLNQFSGEIGKSYFPKDKEDRGNRDVKIKELIINESDCKKIKGITSGSNYSLFVLLLSVVFTLQKLFTNSKDIVVGIPIIKQPHGASLLNTVLPLRLDFNKTKHFKELLFTVSKLFQDANANQNYPFETLLYKLGINNNDDKIPLFDTAVLLENIHEKKYIQHIKNNITFLFSVDEEKIILNIEYNFNRFDLSTITAISSYFEHILTTLINNVETSFDNLNFISDSDRNNQIKFNSTDYEYNREFPISELINQSIKKCPDSTAISCDNDEKSYAEFKDDILLISEYIQNKGVSQNCTVALMGHRTNQMVETIYAVLQAKGVFLPINGQDPGNRISYILKDSNTKFLISDKDASVRNSLVTETFTNSGGVLIILEEMLEELKTRKNENVKDTLLDFGDVNSPAYVIYTSGSTGRPKGVIVTHKNLKNYISWSIRQYVQGEKLDFAFYTSFSFDMTITSIFTPIACGTTLHIYGGDEHEFILEKVIKEGKAQIIKATPSHIKILNASGIKGKVKRFIIGGERFDLEDCLTLHKIYNGEVEIYNEYGPTEATVGCMIYLFKEEYNSGTSVPIGCPAQNSEIYIFDENLQLVPSKVPGNIYIGGECLSQGYLNQPELTNNRFIKNRTFKGNTLYKTGDIGRFIGNNEIEYLSREDEQVKIRGYRIEIGEVEARIKTHEDIIDAAVIVIQENKLEPFLYCYYTGVKNVSSVDLSNYLEEQLPNYMIPAGFLPIERLPIAVSGKVDKKRLPKPEIAQEQEYVAARDESEKKLVEVWGEVLGLEFGKIGIYHNFFELGGHSLSATTIIFKIEKTFNVKLPLETIFKAPTIQSLAEEINKYELIQGNQAGNSNSLEVEITI